MTTTEIDCWVYSPEIKVGSGYVHHAGPRICVEIQEVLENYHGQVQIAKVNRERISEYVNAKLPISTLGCEIRPGDTLRFRFDHKGKKTETAISHLEQLLSKNSN